MELVRWGGVTSVAVSTGLLVVVLLRDVGLNALNGWTILLGLAAGVAVLLRPERRVAATSLVLVVSAMLPALVGGLGLLFVPAVVLLALGCPPRLSRAWASAGVGDANEADAEAGMVAVGQSVAVGRIIEGEPDRVPSLRALIRFLRDRRREGARQSDDRRKDERSTPLAEPPGD